MKLPKFQSHKVVEAFKINDISKYPDGSALLVPLDTALTPIRVPLAYVTKHEPQVGGYYVRYPDGYESWSPAEAFESGYTALDGVADGDREQTEGCELVPLRMVGNGAGIVRLNDPDGATPVAEVTKQDMRLLKMIATGFINQIDHCGNDRERRRSRAPRCRRRASTPCIR